MHIERKSLSLSSHRCAVLRNALCILVPVLMVGLSELLGEPEIIFPEFAALATGAWLTPCAPWRTTSLQIIVLLGLASCAGVGIHLLLPVPMLFQVLIAFLFTGLCLTISRSTFVPMISACILPILMGTDTIVYPLSVISLGVVCIGIRGLMQKYGFVSPFSPPDPNLSLRQSLRDWLLRTLVLGLVAAVPVLTQNYYFIAPPVLVVFVEFTHPKSALRKKPLKILLVIAFSCLIGEGARMLHIHLGFALWLCSCIALILLMLVFSSFKIAFPPAGAMALLPLILPAQQADLCSLKAIIGCALFIGLALLLFRKKQDGSLPQNADSSSL